MIKVYSKTRSKISFVFDTHIEWDEGITDPQLKCDLMNACPTGPFTYHGPTTFSFTGRLDGKDLDEFQKKVEEIYRRYCG
jgi:hypothetical protein